MQSRARHSAETRAMGQHTFLSRLLLLSWRFV